MLLRLWQRLLVARLPNASSPTAAATMAAKTRTASSATAQSTGALESLFRPSDLRHPPRKGSAALSDARLLEAAVALSLVHLAESPRRLLLLLLSGSCQDLVHVDRVLSRVAAALQSRAYWWSCLQPLLLLLLLYFLRWWWRCHLDVVWAASLEHRTAAARCIWKNTRVSGTARMVSQLWLKVGIGCFLLIGGKEVPFAGCEVRTIRQGPR
mmetsp:Transcript_82848/g.173469  ORF Transcript_82848/g.173469 Transcript_82848/m.173469 type:complete len:211 (+) Transcript_82848:422-1054(+)